MPSKFCITVFITADLLKSTVYKMYGYVYSLYPYKISNA